MSDKFHRIRSVLYATPWAITEDAYLQITSIFERAARGEQMPDGTRNYLAGLKIMTDDDDDDKNDKDDELGFDFVNDVAVIPVQGPIFPKANLFTELSGATSIDKLKQSLELAEQLDPAAIIFDIDSPGGSVIGAKDFVSQIRQVSMDNTCPVIACTDGICASLAYMFASACDAVYSTEGSMVGSIGTVMSVDDYDRYIKNKGIDPVVIRSSELKAISGDGGGITPNQKTELARLVSSYFNQFKEVVSQGREGIDIDKVATGQMWPATAAAGHASAMDMGLTDGISSIKQLIKQYGR